MSIYSSTFMVGRNLVKIPIDPPIKSDLRTVSEKIIDLIPHPNATIQPDKMAILDGKLYVNNTSLPLKVPDPITDTNVINAGFSNIGYSVDTLSTLSDLEATSGNIIGSGKSKFVDGVLYINRTPNPIAVPTDRSEASMIVAGFSVNADTSDLIGIKNTLESIEVVLGGTVPAGMNRFFNGTLWSNPTNVDISITSNLDINILLSGLVKVGQASSTETISPLGVVPAGQLRFILGEAYINSSASSVTIPAIITENSLISAGLSKYTNLAASIAHVKVVGDIINPGEQFVYNGVIFENNTVADLTVPSVSSKIVMENTGFTVPTFITKLDSLDASLSNIIAREGSIISPNSLVIVEGALFFNETASDIILDTLPINSVTSLAKGLTYFDLSTMSFIENELSEINANVGDTVIANKVIFVNGRLYINESGATLTIPNDTSVSNLTSIGLKLFTAITSEISSQLSELNVDAGGVVEAGKTKFINGVLYANPSTLSIDVTSVLEADLLASGLMPMTYELLNNEILSDIVATDGDSIPSGQTRFINGNIWINYTTNSITVNAGDTATNLKVKGLKLLKDILDSKAVKSEVEEHNANTGDIIASGRTVFIDGVLYTNVTANDILIPTDTSDTNLSSVGFVVVEGSSSDAVLPQSFVDSLFLDN